MKNVTLKRVLCVGLPTVLLIAGLIGISGKRVDSMFRSQESLRYEAIGVIACSAAANMDNQAIAKYLDELGGPGAASLKTARFYGANESEAINVLKQIVCVEALNSLEQTA